MRSITFHLAAALLAAASLSGCHHKAPAPTPPPAAQAGILATGGRLVLPAVPGRPGAAYFTLVNQGHIDATITAVAIDGAAKAEMHETSGSAQITTMQPLLTLDIRAGGSAILAPGGRHVMAFNLSPRLQPGISTQITLAFSDGSKLSAPLSIEAAGGAPSGGMGDMAGMKM